MSGRGGCGGKRPAGAVTFVSVAGIGAYLAVSAGPAAPAATGLAKRSIPGHSTWSSHSAWRKAMITLPTALTRRYCVFRNSTSARLSAALVVIR
jgi:hypothetical protein